MKTQSEENYGDNIHARISPLLAEALRLYMHDNRLGNRSEVLKSALGQFLEREGYLVKTKDGYELARHQR